MRVLLGLAAPTEGYARVLGVPYAPWIVRSRRSARCSRPRGSIRGARARASADRGDGGDVPTSRVDAVLDQVAMRAPADRKVEGYSSGIRQRLGLATTLLGDPDVLVLDEPGNGLDPAGVAWAAGVPPGVRRRGTLRLQPSARGDVADRRPSRRDRPRAVGRRGAVGAITSSVAEGSSFVRPTRPRSPSPSKRPEPRSHLSPDRGVLSVERPLDRTGGGYAAREGIVLHELRRREATLEERSCGSLEAW